MFVKGHIGTLCVYLLCSNTKPVVKGRQMSSAAKIFFPFLAKHLVPSYFIVLYAKLQATEQERGGG